MNLIQTLVADFAYQQAGLLPQQMVTVAFDLKQKLPATNIKWLH
jgi:hypothetical protein